MIVVRNVIQLKFGIAWRLFISSYGGFAVSGVGSGPTSRHGDSHGVLS